jgi:hypothetical protein
MRSEAEIFLSEAPDALNEAYLKTSRHMRSFVEAHIDALTEARMLQAQERRSGNLRLS